MYERQADEVSTDAGHPCWAASDYLQEAIEKNLKIKARNVKLQTSASRRLHSLLPGT